MGLREIWWIIYRAGSVGVLKLDLLCGWKYAVKEWEASWKNSAQQQVVLVDYFSAEKLAAGSHR